MAQPGARSFKQLQDFAAEMFNNDKAIKEEYDGDSWTEVIIKFQKFYSRFFILSHSSFHYEKRLLKCGYLV